MQINKVLTRLPYWYWSYFQKSNHY